MRLIFLLFLPFLVSACATSVVVPSTNPEPAAASTGAKLPSAKIAADNFLAVVDRVERDAGWDPEDGVAVSMIGFCLLSVFPLALEQYRGQLLRVGTQRVF